MGCSFFTTARCQQHQQSCAQLLQLSCCCLDTARRSCTERPTAVCFDAIALLCPTADCRALRNSSALRRDLAKCWVSIQKMCGGCGVPHAHRLSAPSPDNEKAHMSTLGIYLKEKLAQEDTWRSPSNMPFCMGTQHGTSNFASKRLDNLQ